MEYATHRAYHEVPWLWKFHAVHHSVKTLDWLAGSRLHLLEITVTRVAVLAPLFLLGFEKSVIDTYIIRRLRTTHSEITSALANHRFSGYGSAR
jgi:sterol desaturase/sphingolipid hydroxylase (fatty acid hydroxylase superfamily)